MIKYLLSLLLLVCLNVKSNDPSNVKTSTLFVISGAIIDHVSGEGLAGVTVILQGTDKKTFTDLEGNFSFTDIAPGEYIIIAEYVSYRRRTIRGVRPGNVKEIRLHSESGSGLNQIKKVSYSG